jgi:hypothetical protein
MLITIAASIPPKVNHLTETPSELIFQTKPTMTVVINKRTMDLTIIPRTVILDEGPLDVSQK